MEQSLASSLHVNSWRLGLVILTTKSGNGEVEGGGEIASSEFLPCCAKLLQSSGAPTAASTLQPVFSSVSALPVVESSLVESLPPLLS